MPSVTNALENKRHKLSGFGFAASGYAKPLYNGNRALSFRKFTGWPWNVWLRPVFARAARRLSPLRSPRFSMAGSRERPGNVRLRPKKKRNQDKRKRLSFLGREHEDFAPPSRTAISPGARPHVERTIFVPDILVVEARFRICIEQGFVNIGRNIEIAINGPIPEFDFQRPKPLAVSHSGERRRFDRNALNPGDDAARLTPGLRRARSRRKVKLATNAMGGHRRMGPLCSETGSSCRAAFALKPFLPMIFRSSRNGAFLPGSRAGVKEIICPADW